jgi:acyl-CoA dehydrogenase
MTGQHHFNEIFFEDVLVPLDALVGEEGAGWKQVTAELALERSGPERYLSSHMLLEALIDHAGSDPEPALAELIGRLTAEMWTLRQMSLATAAKLAAGEDPMVEAAIVKDLGNAYEQATPRLVQAVVENVDMADDSRSRGCCGSSSCRAPATRCAAGHPKFYGASSPGGSGFGEDPGMSENRQLLTDMAEGLFAELSGVEFAAAWPRLADAGFAGLLVAEDRGGFGGDWGDLYAVLRLAGQNTVAAPLGETVLAHKLLAEAGVPAPEGPIGLLDGERVAFGRHCAAVVAAGEGGLRLHVRDAIVWEDATSPAGEPRDKPRFTGEPVAAFASNGDLRALGAFGVVAQAAGALEAGFALAIEHVNTRVQFGKPLGKFQAVQQALAEASEHIAAVGAAGQAAAAALDAGDASFEIAAAKLRTNLAIDATVPVLHRVHGAIGFTMEYPLNRYTRRLMGWRSAFGNDTYWARRLGGQVARLGGRGLWRDMAARGDRK